MYFKILEAHETIDMEYILQNVPSYADAKNQLEQKAQKWKQEIETKRNAKRSQPL